MRIVVDKPELREFVEDQLKRGRFASPTEVVEAALAHLRDELDEGFDDATRLAIERAAQQLDRGEGRPLDEVAASLRQRYNNQPL